MAVAVQADKAFERTVSLQNQVMQINSSTLRTHERQERLETFVDEFTSQIAVAVQA